MKKSMSPAEIQAAELKQQYQAKRHLDSKLPKDPETFYSTEWKGWAHFMGVPKAK